MKELFENIFFKMGMIVILILLLLIPAVMVQGLIKERMHRHNEAIFEVSSKHADNQTIAGPVLSIPFYETKNVREQNGTYREVKTKNYLHILPDQLDIKGEVDPEKRKRGIYEVVVYGSDLNFNGNYKPIDLDKHGISKEHVLWDKAFITVGISDLKGVTDQVKLKANGKSYMFNPGVISNDIVGSGLHTMFPLDSGMQKKIDFNFDLKLNGSDNLMMLPIGKETNVNLASEWPDPSFTGNFLPAFRKVTKSGFDAKWKVLHLNRNFPQEWIGNKHQINTSAFGVSMRLPVDVYQKSERVAKYAVLFITLTYLVFFFVEVLNRILIHPVQYILVGLALVLFYVLLLAFSEQIQFNMAYLVSSVMTIGLVTLYCRSILKSWGLAMMTGSILSILYGFIFIIIQMQDLALLFGSLGIFLILATTMYFSRKIEWFELKKSEIDKE